MDSVNSTIVTDTLPDGSLRPIGTGEMIAEIMEMRDRPIMKRWLAEQRRMDALYPHRRAASVQEFRAKHVSFDDTDAPEWRPNTNGEQS